MSKKSKDENKEPVFYKKKLVKILVKESDMRISKDSLATLNTVIKDVIMAAVESAKAGKAKTIKPEDFDKEEEKDEEEDKDEDK